ncbi:DUF3962 domain-containing protein [Neobacillus sp. 114]|uniref:pPIWI_RE module domain-containing protein n=1 Tax=Neobacillus sp. 114 TaxID=3048535 RepID=UPI0024C21F22|nr:DUF3962 domain-containing protein [Neobacillus sp. 114]
MANDVMELFSFEVDTTVFETEEVFYLHFPVSWRNFLEIDKDDYKLKWKPKNLGKKLQGVFSTIFHVSWKANEPWLLADKKVDSEIIKLICLNWFAKENDCTVKELPFEIQNSPLIWQSSRMGDLYKEYKKDEWKYGWIPGLMARKFASEPRNLKLSNGTNRNLIFHHVYFNGNHECMSKPVKNKEKSGAFSYVIRFSLKTRGGLPEPSILNVSFCIRRILQRGIKKLNDVHYKRKGSILISIKDPFTSDCLQPLSYAQLKYKKQSGQVAWAEGTDALFADLLGCPFQPEQVIKDPMVFMESTNPSAFAVYSDLIFTSKYNLSKVVNGIGLPEKWALFDLVKDIFEELSPLKPCTNILSRNDSIGNERFPLRHSFAPGSILRLEIWGEEDFYHQAINTYLLQEIIFENVDGTYRLNAEPAINLEFVSRHTGKLAEALDSGQDSKAYDKRVRWIEKMAASETGNDLPTMSLVEIGLKENYESGTDPKKADRDGLAFAGRVSQFIYPLEHEEGEDKAKSRIVNSFFDLLMDHGFLPARASNLNEDTIYLGLGMIKGTPKGRKKEVFLPVVTRFHQNEVKIRLFGKNEWLSVNEALLASGKLTLSSLLDRAKKQNDSYKRYMSFFKRAIENCLVESESDIVILLDAKLRNQKWAELTNPLLDYHKLPFTLEHPDATERIRVIRVNTTDDVSQYRINPKGIVKENRNKGLFKDTAGIYYSIGQRPDNMQSPLRKQKFEYPGEQILHQRPVEFIPLGTANQEERDLLATLTHHMRKLNIAYPFHTILPYPLDIMKSIKKYMTVLVDEYEDNDPDVFEEWIYEDENAQFAISFSE